MLTLPLRLQMKTQVNLIPVLPDRVGRTTRSLPTRATTPLSSPITPKTCRGSRNSSKASTPRAPSTPTWCRSTTASPSTSCKWSPTCWNPGRRLDPEDQSDWRSALQLHHHPRRQPRTHGAGAQPDLQTRQRPNNPSNLRGCTCAMPRPATGSTGPARIASPGKAKARAATTRVRCSAAWAATPFGQSG